MAASRSRSDQGPHIPWWRIPMVWLVISGPAVVVVAGIVTAVIAVKGADPVLDRNPEVKFSDRPAMQGRNHAATPTDHR
ncbi:MAG: nitrogen fixation protein FixH [Rubrivivax sp.]|nr:nitrogen fixation protein FixH [Rubrivivax sp.]